MPVASFTITKLSWLHRSEPEAWQRLAHVVLPHDWLTFRLTGRLVTDRGDASGTGYWSAATGGLPPRPARHRRRRPRLVGGGAGGARARRGRRRVAGRARRARAPATTWPARSASGSRPGDVAVSIGTSGTVYSVSDEPTADPSGIVAGFADATGRHLPLVCTLNATKVTEAVRRLLGVDHDDVRRARAGRRDRAPAASRCCRTSTASARPTGPTRPACSPGSAATSAASSSPGPPSKGVVCGLLDGLDALDAFAPADGRLILVGGGARSRAYRQVLADLSGRAVLVPARRRAGRHRRVRAGRRRGRRRASPPTSPIAGGSATATSSNRDPDRRAAADVRAAYAAVRDAS